MDKKDGWLIMIIVALIVLVVVFWDDFIIEKDEIIESDYCEVVSDCVVAIHPEYCCDCPIPYNKEFVEADKDLVVYQEGVDYSVYQKKENCDGIVCGVACNDLGELNCVSNKCVK